MIKGAIFDVDGTLLDSMEIWEDAGVRYLKNLQIESEKGLSEVLYPMTIEEGAIYIKKQYALNSTIPEIVKGVLDTVKNYYYYEAPLKKGVRDFLGKMKQKEIPMVIATSSVREHIEAAFRRLEIDQYFDAVFTCSEVGEGKKRPLIYQKAAQYLREKPEEIYVFEDALYALITAKKAGFCTVGVYDRFSESEQEQLKDEADIYLSDMTDFSKFERKIIE